MVDTSSSAGAPAVTTLTAAELAMASDTIHNLIYFPFHGLAGCIRTTLVLSNEPFKITNMEFSNWPVEKQVTPFGHVPVLRLEHPSGHQPLELAEISTIEHFLAKKSNLLGNDSWEEHLIRMYHSSTHALYTFLIHTVVQSPKEDRATFLGRFKKTNLKEWVQFHEKHLKANGSNGHYVGDQLSIADIKTASVVEHLIRLSGEEEVQISQELTPAIMAVKTNLEKHPKYAEWRASEQYQGYTARNVGFFGF